MSDIPSGNEEELPPPPNYVPALAQIHDAITDPTAQSAVGTAGAYLNDYAQQRNIEQRSQATSQQFIQNLGQFRSGLLDMVRGDPLSVHAAMRAAVPVMTAAVNSTIGPDHEEQPAHVATLLGDVHRDLATAAVTSAAEQSAPLARSLLDDPRVAGVLPDDHRASLDTYVDMQDRARQVDNSAQRMQQAQLADTRANHSMFKYASGLLNPDTGSVVFPPRWNQSVLADQSVTPQDTATLRGLYARMAAGGNAESSDPFLVSGLVRDMADGGGPPIRDILGHAANGNLALADALHLASLSADKGQQGQGYAASLSGLLDQGRQAIMGADPIAGARAYGRYVNWLLPRFQQTGVLGANPDEPAFLLKNGISSFMPRPEDLLPAAPRANRRPLKEIFGG